MPFRIPPPSDDLRAPARLDQPSWGPKLSGANIPSGGELRVKLPLRKVLSGILPFQLSGPEAHEVPDAAEVEFPFSIIQPQLSFGRIQVSPAQFQAGLSEELRTRFTINDPDTPIALPLPDVLQSLPNDCLRLRGDQDEIESVEQFETPFSQKAAEDAARIKQGIAPIVGRAPTDLSRTEPVRTELVAEPAKRIAVKVRIPPSLTTTAATESAFVSSRLPCEANEPEALDAKAAVAQASSLPGVQACGIVFSDGLSLAENLPSACEMDGLCAIAPAFMKKIGEQVGGARVGPLTGVTLFCGQAGITFFAHGNICLAALHSACEALTAEVRARLDRVAKELAQTYAESA
jgi:predicted regulator of Ras-like GTPase activity (Roadblock/LC7/MglB family)